MGETRHRTTLEINVDDRALRQLAPTMERALNPRVVEAFEKSLERSTNALSKMVEQQAKLGKMMQEQFTKVKAARREDDHAQRERDNRTARSVGRGAGVGSFLGTMGGNMMGRANQMAGSLPFNEGFLAQMMGAIPVLGPAFGGAVSGMMGFYQSFAQQQIARARAFGSSGLTNRQFGGLAGAGYSMGLGPAEMAGFIGQTGQATGLRGSSLAGVVPRSLQLQTLLGIDSGASGSIINAAMTAGDPGDEDRAVAMMTEAVADGIAAGVREGRLGEVLQQLGGFVGQMRTEGIRLDIADTIGLMRGLGLLGGAFTGEAGAAAARSITQGFSGAGDREGVLSAMAIRQRMSEFGEDYETAARAIESRPVDAFRGVMTTLSQFRGTRGFETMLRTQFQRLGINLSREQAHQLAGAGGESFLQMAPAEAGLGEQSIMDLLGQRGQQAPLGTAQAEASYEGARAGIGGGMAGTVQRYRGLELRMIRAFRPYVEVFVEKTIEEVGMAFQAFAEGGFGGLMEHMMGRIFEGLTELGNQILSGLGINVDEAVSSVTNVTSGAAGVSAIIDDATANAIESVFGENAVSDSLREAAQIHRRVRSAANTPEAESRGLPGNSAPAGTIIGYSDAEGTQPIYSTGQGGNKAMKLEITIVDRTLSGVEVAR